MEKSFDIIVLGLGAMGSAAVYQLSKKGVKVLGIDQFSPPHIYGSTHGDTRITRLAIGEGEQYVPLVMRSHEIWREIEKQTEMKLLTVTGGLVVCSVPQPLHHSSTDFLTQTISSAEKYHIRHEILNADQIKKRWPQFNLKGTEKGYFEYAAGYVSPENCILAQLQLAEKNGATIHKNEKVLSYSSTLDNVTVTTNQRTYTAKKLIISAGPWINDFMPEEYKNLFKIHKQILYWFDVPGNITPFLPGNFPIFMWFYGERSEDYLYGFPAIDGPHGGIKVAGEQYVETTDPDSVDREVHQEEIDFIYEKHIKNYLPSISKKVIKAVSCLYTVTPDYNFIIDFLPNSKNIIVASPCSGHGFKHSAAIGEILAEMATEGKSKLDISSFTFFRFSK